jgi:hypothetical protein
MSSQELKQRELNKISKLGINTGDLNIYDENLTNDFRDILRANRKRKSNKTVGIILSSLSAVSLGFGIGLIANPVESTGHENAFRGLIGSFAIVTGTIEGGIGIPLLFVSNKRKRERDLLIKEYKGQPK